MSHLSYEQRYTIEVLLKDGKKKSEIASLLSVHKSTITNELKRNSDGRNKEYRSSLAQKKCEQRHRNKTKYVKFDDQLQYQVNSLIKKDYSPEQITGYLKKMGLSSVSHERIYTHIWKDKKNKGDLYLHLRRKGRRYRKRGSSKDSRGMIVGRVGIEHRPKEADTREVFGHFEVDTIIGKNHQGAIITLNELASGMIWMKKVSSRDARLVREKLCDRLDEIKPFLKTITSDNGKEFSEHQYITDQYCDFYFANPYSPWERGANENLNGLIRQYIPKSTDLSTVSDQRIKEIEKILNTRPRKRLNFENPIFVMEQLLFNSEVAFMS